MAYSSKSSSFHKILILVFGIAFGLVALAMVFQGAKTSGDIRSRAAQTSQIYKQWEFNGSDSEGWFGVAPYTGSVTGGIFMVSGPKASSLPAFRNTSVGVILPAGLKSISLSMAITPARNPIPTTGKGAMDATDDNTFQRTVSSNVACTLEARTCSDGSYVGRSGKGCSFMPCPDKGQRKFVGHLYYKLSNRDKFESPIQFSGNADGSFQTYTVNLPNAENISIDSIRVVLTSGVKNGETVAVDWIRVLGPVPTPTPVNACNGPNGSSCSISNCPPEPTCKPGEKCFRMGRPCTITQGICQSNQCIPGSVPTPTPTCKPRPACLDSKPRCLIPETSDMCPRPTPPIPVFENAINLDGKTGYIVATNSSLIQPSLGFTVEAWFKPSIIPSSGRLVSKMSGSENSFSILITSEQDPTNSNNIRFHYEFGVTNSGSNCNYFTISNDYIVAKDLASRWQHIAGVIQLDGKMDLFINGQRSVSSSNSISGVCSRNLPIVIGARQQTPGSIDSYIVGVVDEVRISKIARYTVNFAPPMGPFNHDSNDILLYHLDNSTSDASGNGYTGTLFGNATYVFH